MSQVDALQLVAQWLVLQKKTGHYPYACPVRTHQKLDHLFAFKYHGRDGARFVMSKRYQVSKYGNIQFPRHLRFHARDVGAHTRWLPIWGISVRNLCKTNKAMTIKPF